MADMKLNVYNQNGEKVSTINVAKDVFGCEVNNQVMFITFQGDYTCNSKAICDYILKNKLDYKIIWVIRSEKENDIKQFPHGIKVVSRDSNEFYYEYERRRSKKDY